MTTEARLEQAQAKDFGYSGPQLAEDPDPSNPHGGIRPLQPPSPLNPEEEARKAAAKEMARQRMAYARACKAAQAAGEPPPLVPDNPAVFSSTAPSVKSRSAAPTQNLQNPPDLERTPQMVVPTREVSLNRVQPPEQNPAPSDREQIEQAKANLAKLEQERAGSEASRSEASRCEVPSARPGDTAEVFHLFKRPEFYLGTMRLILGKLGVRYADLPVPIQGQIACRLKEALEELSLADRLFLSAMQELGMGGRKLAEIIAVCATLAAFREALLAAPSEAKLPDQDDQDDATP